MVSVEGYAPHRVVQRTIRTIMGGGPGVSGLLSSVERHYFKSLKCMTRIV